MAVNEMLNDMFRALTLCLLIMRNEPALRVNVNMNAILTWIRNHQQLLNGSSRLVTFIVMIYCFLYVCVLSKWVRSIALHVSVSKTYIHSF